MKQLGIFLFLFITVSSLYAKVQQDTLGNLVLEDVPSIPEAIRTDLLPFLETRYASFRDWLPNNEGMLIRTRLGEVSQLHIVEYPKAYRKQITFSPEPLSFAIVCPDARTPYFLYTMDIAGTEKYQIYKFNYHTLESELLSDGVSRHMAVTWSNKGDRFAFASTMRNEKDFDIYLGTLSGSKSFKRIFITSGYWYPIEFSPDDSRLLIKEYRSSHESYLYIFDIKSAAMIQINPIDDAISYWSSRWSKDGKGIYYVSDEASDFHQLIYYDIVSKQKTILTKGIPWDINEIEIAPSGDTIALVANEEGIGTLYFLNTRTHALSKAKLPIGAIYNLKYKPDGSELAMVINTPRAPSDIYSLNLKKNTFIRWTYSELGSIDTTSFSLPELFHYPTFDSIGDEPRSVPAYIYRPKNAKPPFPVLVDIHGGPTGQYTPGFAPLTQYLVTKLGIAIIAPNIRGSSGYGKEFIALDNFLKREDAVKDIGALLDWIDEQPDLDDSRVGVMGGSYGGYMVLASLVHFSKRLACGIDIVGISNFVTFLENTGKYRQDLRRTEYGDERDPEMREFLESISPLTNANRITTPLLVVQGLNDPRVPVTEAEQIVKAVRKNGNDVWYVLGLDEGHGFGKKTNRDTYQYIKVLFLQRYLLK